MVSVAQAAWADGAGWRLRGGCVQGPAAVGGWKLLGAMASAAPVGPAWADPVLACSCHQLSLAFVQAICSLPVVTSCKGDSLLPTQRPREEAKRRWSGVWGCI